MKQLLAVLCFIVIIATHTRLIAQETIVIGDVHGAYDELAALLTHIKLIDEEHNWQGGEHTLISLGDLVDRGADSKKVIELMMQLHQQAQTAGGALLQTLGNHEVMLMSGDLRYVSTDEFAAYISLSSQEVRADWYQRFLNINELEENQQSRQIFDKTFPLGITGLVRAWSPTGEIGRWLRQHAKVIYKKHNSLLAHGGISDKYSKLSVDTLNQQVASALAWQDQLQSRLWESGALPLTLQEFDFRQYIHQQSDAVWHETAQEWLALQQSILFNPKGPLWHRGNVLCNEAIESFSLSKAAESYDINKVVVGHTPKYTRVLSRLDGMLIMADTGMLSSHYGGRGSAVKLFDSDVKAAYTDKTNWQDVKEEQSKFNANPSGLSDQQIETFLSNAKIVSREDVGVGITRPEVITLFDGVRELKAIFKSYDNVPKLKPGIRYKREYNKGDRFYYEIAAYRIDRLLGQNLVPPVVLRKINNTVGALQLWVPDSFSENARKDNQIAYNGYCSLDDIYRVRIIFDTLIFNWDRNDGNYLWDRQFNVYFIDHTRTFSTKYELPEMYEDSKVRLSKFYRERLKSLTREKLSDVLDDILHEAQINAILKRRDLLLEMDDKLLKN